MIIWRIGLIALIGAMSTPVSADVVEVYAIAVCHVYSDPERAKHNFCQLLRPEYFIFRSAEGCEKALREATGLRDNSDSFVTTTYNCVHKTISTWSK